MKFATEFCENVYRITFPFKDIYTTVTVIRTPEGDMAVDLASFDSDIDEILLPALEEIGVTKESLKYALITHPHGDHAGGLLRFRHFFPETKILAGSAEGLAKKFEGEENPVQAVREGEIFLSALLVTEIPGHTKDAVGILDTRKNLLVCGDCLQQYGIYGSGKWGSNIRFPAEHIAAVEKLRKMPIDAVLSAHDYYPVGFEAHGREKVFEALDACTTSLLRLREYMQRHPELDDEALAEAYNAASGLPTVGAHVFTALRKL